LAAALATTVVAPFAPGVARAQDQIKDQAKDPAADQAKDRATNQPQNRDQTCPGNSNALGTSRVLPVDFSKYQRLGLMQYPDSLLLNDKEVVLTFDDGPLPPYSNEVLDILSSECVKATFFMVGEMARAFPANVRRAYEQGHTIGTHSEDHPSGFEKLPIERVRHEIDRGIADVAGAFGGDPKYLAPFFRIPGLERSDAIESEAAARGLIVFSSDTVADDWHHRITAKDITALAIKRLEVRGKGILLLHDIHPKTVAALPGLLKELKDHGFHIVQVVPSAAYQIAMAHRPATKVLASALPGELTVGGGIDDTKRPTWPQAADDRTPDDVVLPVPDVAAFDPDTGLTVDGAAAQWPDQPQAIAAAPVPDAPAPHRAKLRLERNKKVHVAEPSQHERLRPGRHHGRARTPAAAGADGQHADLASAIKSLAAVFSPAPATAAH